MMVRSLRLTALSLTLLLFVGVFLALNRGTGTRSLLGQMDGEWWEEADDGTVFDDGGGQVIDQGGGGVESGVCGNGYCEYGEDYESCWSDCQPICASGPCCGDGSCMPPIESRLNCSQDCAAEPGCGDGICYSLGENPWNCPEDCPGVCGDGWVMGGEECESRTDCPVPEQYACNSCRCELLVSTCGDGILENGEQCERKPCPQSGPCNASLHWVGCNFGDQCVSCRCSSQGEPVCGDGTVQTANNEQCDGDNLAYCSASQHCDSSCQCAEGTTPSGCSVCTNVGCGSCRNAPGATGCFVHNVSGGFTCVSVPDSTDCGCDWNNNSSSSAESVCGNGLLEAGEVCDDNPYAINGGCGLGEGCAADCRSCIPTSISSHPAGCGNGTIEYEIGEECENGNVSGCSSGPSATCSDCRCTYAVSSFSSSSSSSSFRYSANSSQQGCTASCWDSEGGRDPNRSGSVSVTQATCYTQNYTEYCSDFRTVVEYSCQGTAARTEYVSCPVGECVGGACTQSSGGCASAVQCNDNNPCTTDVCTVNHTCFNMVIPGCGAASSSSSSSASFSSIPTVRVCRDGIRGPSEQCDDANNYANDGCTSYCTVEVGWSCTGSPSACTPVCGDRKIILGREFCDDGNIASGDGCSAQCAIERGWSCPGLPSVCRTMCGDRIVAGAEQCDDGNLEDGDGCSAKCQLEIATVSSPSSVSSHSSSSFFSVNSLCGNGRMESGEECERGIRGCSTGLTCNLFLCKCEKSVVVSSSVSSRQVSSATISVVCGNGVLEQGEFCETDIPCLKNGICVAGCQCLIPPSVSASQSSSSSSSSRSSLSSPAALPYCGDGKLEAEEQCEVGIWCPAGLCMECRCVLPSSSSQLFVSSLSSPAPLPTFLCGNGVPENGEQCDDGNAASQDGCDALCRTETGYACFGLPSSCHPVCGDGIVISPEQCDDGNIIDDDGCSTVCEIERAAAPSSFESSFASFGALSVCGNGLTEIGEECDDGNLFDFDGCSHLCTIEEILSSASSSPVSSVSSVPSVSSLRSSASSTFSVIIDRPSSSPGFTMFWLILTVLFLVIIGLLVWLLLKKKSE
ncbi:MAG: DUF4215 domain-containing protein [Candidatus Peribacteraceae bacterium]|nr:DUF4215 domain-containing protein [Candidatus Peribacteraceae bacterium]